MNYPAVVMAIGGAFLAGCGPAKPTQDECVALATWLREIGGNAGTAEYECVSKFNREEVQCLRQRGWKRIVECPGFSKLEIEKELFTGIHCFSIETETYSKHECGYPWVNCEKLRRNELLEGAGKQVSPCTWSATPYVIQFSCRDGEACAKYFENAEECRKSLPLLRATENNVSECAPG